MIVCPKNAKRGRACALPLFAKAKISLSIGFAKTRQVVPPAVKRKAGDDCAGTIICKKCRFIF